MIEQLNEDSVGIPKVKGPGPVTMGLNRLNQRYTVGRYPRSHKVNILRPAYYESDVMYALNRAWLRAFRKLVDGEVIASGREINVVWIGFPFDSHSQDIAIEVGGVANVPDIEGNVTET